MTLDSQLSAVSLQQLHMIPIERHQHSQGRQQHCCLLNCWASSGVGVTCRALEERGNAMISQQGRAKSPFMLSVWFIIAHVPCPAWTAGRWLCCVVMRASLAIPLPPTPHATLHVEMSRTMPLAQSCLCFSNTESSTSMNCELILHITRDSLLMTHYS